MLGDLRPQSCAAPAAPEVPEVGVVYTGGTFGLLPNSYQLMEHVVSLVSGCLSLCTLCNSLKLLFVVNVRNGQLGASVRHLLHQSDLADACQSSALTMI